jgi:hypothetical protein
MMGKTVEQTERALHAGDLCPGCWCCELVVMVCPTCAKPAARAEETWEREEMIGACETCGGTGEVLICAGRCDAADSHRFHFPNPSDLGEDCDGT